MERADSSIFCVAAVGQLTDGLIVSSFFRASAGISSHTLLNTLSKEVMAVPGDRDCFVTAMYARGNVPTGDTDREFCPAKLPSLVLSAHLNLRAADISL